MRTEEKGEGTRDESGGGLTGCISLLIHHPVSISSLFCQGTQITQQVGSVLWIPCLMGLKWCLCVTGNLTCLASILGPPSGVPHVHNVCSLIIIYTSLSSPRTLGVNHKVSTDTIVHSSVWCLYGLGRDHRGPESLARLERACSSPGSPPCSNTKCYYIINGQFIILFFMILCFYIAVRRSE